MKVKFKTDLGRITIDTDAIGAIQEPLLIDQTYVWMKAGGMITVNLPYDDVISVLEWETPDGG